MLDDPQAMERFQQAQGQLGSALSRLLVVAENYPGLKANQGFQDLRVQLEGTENRVTVARNRYIETVQQYNVLARSFPSNLTAMVFGYQPKPGFTVADEAAISSAAQGRLRRPGRTLSDAAGCGVSLLILAALFATGLALCPAAAAGAGAAGACDRSHRVLSAAQVRALEAKLAAFEAAHGSQVVVLLVRSTAPEDIAAYAFRVADAWKIGRREVGDGVLLLVAKDDRKVRIEVARALEGAIPDLAAWRIIDGAITPAFRRGDFAGGIDAGVEACSR
jgi:hypothetical protein